MMEQPISPALPEALRHELQLLLTPREELLWVGQPKQGLLFRKSDGLLIPSTLGWVGILTAILVTIGTTQGIGPLLPIAGVFCLLGFWLLIGRFLLDSYQRARTVYGITNRRILIATSGISGNVQSLDIKSLETLKVEEGRDGRGTITLAEASSMPRFGFESPMREGELPLLEAIPNARAVYTLIQGIRD